MNAHRARSRLEDAPEDGRLGPPDAGLFPDRNDEVRAGRRLAGPERNRPRPGTVILEEPRSPGDNDRTVRAIQVFPYGIPHDHIGVHFNLYEIHLWCGMRAPGDIGTCQPQVAAYRTAGSLNIMTGHFDLLRTVADGSDQQPQQHRHAGHPGEGGLKTVHGAGDADRQAEGQTEKPL